MNTTALDKEIEEKRAINKEAWDKLITYMRQVAEKWVSRAVSSVHIANAKVGHVSDSNIALGIDDSSKSRSFDLYFYEDWGTEVRRLKLNFPCFGSFEKDDAVSVDFCKLLGFIAGHMEEIEHDLVKSTTAAELRKAYETAHSELYGLEDQKRKILEEEKLAAKQADIDRIREALVPGAKLRVGWSWDKKPAYDEIDRVSAKCIWRKHNYGCRELKDVVIDNIHKGLWDLVD